MTTHGSVTQCIHDLRSDDPSTRNKAAQLIWERYFDRLLGLVHNNLDRQVRRRVDEEDVFQSMYKSFCLRIQLGKYEFLTNRDDLWKLLVTITLNKARNAAMHEKRMKRNPNREQTAPKGDETGSAWGVLEQIEAAGPSPEEAAMLNEALEQRLQALADPELRGVALSKLEGHTNAEIAIRLGYVERTVERMVAKIKRAWESFDDDSFPTPGGV